MKEIPILYSTLMVQAKLAGRKTETRRIIKPRIEYTSTIPNQTNPESFTLLDEYGNYIYDWDYLPMYPKCPYGKPGDLHYVRETCVYETDGVTWAWVYKADMPDYPMGSSHWTPSIHMPKSAARIWEEVLEVRVERLQDITEEGAIAEGIEEQWVDLTTPTLIRRNYLKKDVYQMDISAVDSYRTLWESIYGPESWDENPWVWVIKTKTLSTTGKPPLT